MAEMNDIQKAHKERKEAYYSLQYKLDDMRHTLQNIKKNRGHSTAFKQLMLSIDAYNQQIRDDFSRYEKQVNKIRDKDSVFEMQTALNRERKLRHELELKVKEASESSGLFIRFVRDKLGV